MDVLTEHQKFLAEWSYPKGLTHEARLPQDNPLQKFPYWDGPSGKNLTIIASLEWALVHLKHCNNELPCEENVRAMGMLQGAIRKMKSRIEKRLAQNVLGTMLPHISS